MPKIGLYPDSKLSCLSIIQSQENRLSHRPISSAIGTGGLDFLIANALLILCHSLFKVVIQDILEGRNVHLLTGQAVHAVRDGDIAYIVFGEKDFDIAASFNIISTKSG